MLPPSFDGAWPPEGAVVAADCGAGGVEVPVAVEFGAVGVGVGVSVAVGDGVLEEVVRGPAASSGLGPRLWTTLLAKEATLVATEAGVCPVAAEAPDALARRMAPPAARRCAAVRGLGPAPIQPAIHAPTPGFDRPVMYSSKRAVMRTRAGISGRGNGRCPARSAR